MCPNPVTLRRPGASANPSGIKRPRPSNDNSQNPPYMPRYAWNVYRAAARARWVGRVEAVDADEAVIFDSDVRKLIAVRRREIAWPNKADLSTGPSIRDHYGH
jgi:hypothetical protein